MTLKIEKELLWDGHNLHIRIEGKIILAGGINTRKFKLTRVQKLKAVQFSGQWIKL